jgi:cell division protein FtsA
VAKETHIVGLDVGTFGVRAVSLLYGGKDSVVPRFLGYVHSPSRGVRKGQIIHIEDAVAVIGKTLLELEKQIGTAVKRIHVGITGSHLHTIASNGVVAIRNSEVRAQDLKRVVEAAQAVPVPSDREVLHVIPQSYTVDGHTDIKDPLGISGVRLEARVQIVTAASHGAQNLMKCINRCGYAVSEIVFSPISLAYSLLSPDEVEQGVCVVDIGAGTTEIAMFIGGVLAAASVLPVGGHHITNDLAAGLRTAIRDAEELKLKLDIDSPHISEVFTVPELGRDEARAVPGAKLRQIVYPRLEEIFSLVHQEMKLLQEVAGLGIRPFTAGVVLTGGTARLKGITKVADDVLKVPTRVSLQLRDGVINGVPPEMSQPDDNVLVACGLARFDPHSSMVFNQTKTHVKSDIWFRRVSSWFSENF